MMNFTCGAFELAAGAGGAAISGTVVLPPTLPPPSEAPLRASCARGLEGERSNTWTQPCPMASARFAKASRLMMCSTAWRVTSLCIGTSHVSWDATGTRNGRGPRVYVTERFVIECDGDCRNVRYTPRVDCVGSPLRIDDACAGAADQDDNRRWERVSMGVHESGRPSSAARHLRAPVERQQIQQRQPGLPASESRQSIGASDTT